MNFTFLRDLAVNLSVLFTASTLYMYIFTAYRKKKTIMNILIGFISAAVGVLLLLISVQLVPGIVFDTRSILVSTTGLFFGAVPVRLSPLLSSALSGLSLMVRAH